MKKIDISTKTYPNTFTTVDSSEYESLVADKWRNTGGYAGRAIDIGGGKQGGELMHRRILNAPEGVQVDHINHDTLDNRRANLRLCSLSQNQMNRKLASNNTSGYKGVSWQKDINRWVACIKKNGKRKYLGAFTCLMKAARAYDQGSIDLFGEFANVNFKEQEND